MRNISIPNGWTMVEKRIDGESFLSPNKKIFVIISVSTELDGKQWLHLSASHKNRTPNYEELCFIKNNFIGEDEYMIMVLPPKKLYVNIHPYCLHLWHCIDDYPLPEFSRGLGTI